MTATWYFALDGEQHGPLPEEDLRRRFLGGELPSETLVWSEGMAGWAPASRVAELTRPAPPPPPPRPAVAGGAPVLAAAGVGSRGAASRPAMLAHRPWARLGARIMDVLLFQSLLALALPSSWLPSAEETLAFQLATVAFAVASLLLWAFVEAFFLSRWGMTPGKWAYRVRVVHPEGRFLSYGEALRRALGVYIQGLALGLPGVQLIAMALAMKELTETGAAPWDRGRFTIQHAQPRPIHQAAVFGLILLFVILSVPVLDRLSG